MKRPPIYRRTLSFLVSIASAIPFSLQAQTNCFFQDIGSAGGSGATTAYGLSLEGPVVVGSTPTTDGVYHAFFWTNNIMTLLPSLGGDAQATAVNRGGDTVVGYSYTTNGNYHAVMWSLFSGEIIDLGTLGGTNSSATALNDTLIVGDSQAADNTEHAFILNIAKAGSGILTDLGSLQPSGGYTIASGINYSSSEVCGQSLWWNSDWHGYPGPNYNAYVWTSGQMIDLYTMSGQNSYAAAINDHGDTCGTSDMNWAVGGGTLGFLRVNGSWISLGYNVNPTALNNSDVVVGNAGNAFVWENGTFYGLTSLVAGIPTTLSTATAINDVGQMVANGANGHAYLLSPVEQPIIATPPPSQTVGIGTTATFSVTAVGFPALTYQWAFDGTNIAGATGSTLTITNLQVSNAGSYTVIVSDPAGTTTSTPAQLTVLPSLAINMAPALSLTGNVGSTYAIQYMNAVGPTNSGWTTLAVVTLTSSTQYWSDYSAIGQPSRFYRLQQQ